MSVLDGHTDGVVGALAFPDGSTIVSWSRDSSLRLWDAATGACLRVLQGHSGGVDGALLLNDGRSIVSWCKADFAVCVWGVRGCSRFITDSPISCVRQVAGGEPARLLVASQSGAAHFLDILGS